MEFGLWRILIAVVLVVVFIQGGKFVFSKRKNVEDLWSFGGKISSHSAVVSALTLGVYLIQGFSLLFVISLVLSGVVVRDSFGFRRKVGVGHSFKESLLGVVFGLVVMYLVWIV
jgi:acid phosphatase family membrane protein YuiD